MAKIKLKNNKNKFLSVYTETYAQFLEYNLNAAKDFLYSLNKQNDYKILKLKISGLTDLKINDKLLDKFDFYSENNAHTFEKNEFELILENTKKLLPLIPELNRLFLELKKDVDLSKIPQEYIDTPGFCTYKGQPPNEKMYFIFYKQEVPFHDDLIKKFFRAYSKLQVVDGSPISINQSSFFVIFHKSDKKEGFVLPYHPSQFSSSRLGDITQARTWKNVDEALDYVKTQGLQSYQIVEILPVIKRVVKTSGSFETDINQVIASQQRDILSSEVLQKRIEEYEEILQQNNIPIPKIAKTHKL